MAEQSPATAILTATLEQEPHAASHIEIVDIPFFEGEWLKRVYPAPHHQGFLKPRELSSEQLVDEYRGHTERLAQEYGIITAEHYSAPTRIIRRGVGHWAIQSLVEIIEGKRFPHHTSWTENTAHINQAADLAERLIDYYTDVQYARLPYFMGDISRIEQYVATEHGHVVRVDTDPILFQTARHFHSEVYLLDKWARALPDSHSLCERIQNLG